ncbi:hypothetical protein TanjilG_10511 [Lupinus angustifolius]|uniref:Uncharacterized protein n=1 Tax=Lupinus angustifolius TaxID=3871 RepID=A0A1J7FW35_LUPAN|nr:hypothetical protein TanjilG_10511 [Lupinus angustifolius]
MSQWRKQQDQSHHQMGYWRSSSYNKKPPLDNWHSAVPSWEKKFCATVGAVPWRKLLESQKYMYLHENVVNWDDSAGKEAFDNAKSRFWADINGLHCNISLPDPDVYIDDVDWNSSVEPELFLDLERDAIDAEVRDQEVVILDSSLLMDQSFSCTGWGDIEEATPKPYDMDQPFTPTGWGDAEESTPKPYDMNQSITPTGWGDAEEAAQNPSDLNQPFTPTGWGDAEEEKPKPSDPVSAAEGWERNLRENNEVGSWGQYRYDSCGWNKRSHYGGNRNSGTWDGYNRKRENMTWSRTPAYHGNEYQMNRGGRRNNRGRGRGNFVHHDSYVEKVPAATPW